MVQITGGVLGTKAVSLGDFDEFLDYLVSGGDGSEPQDLYAAVAWTFWCVNLRCNNISQVPYGIYPKELAKEDENEDNAVDWPTTEQKIDLRQMLWDVEAWLSLKAAAYVLKRANRVAITDLQVLNANTMRVFDYDADGPTVFRQQVGSQWKDYPAEEIVYFRTFNPKDDINAGVASGQVGEVTGALIKHANEWASKFFSNGAIPAVMLTTDGPVPPNEKTRIESVWEKMLKGVQKAFKTVVLERGLKPTVIGMPIKDLAMPDLERTKREQILAAHLIPPGLAEAKTNRAERDALQYELWTQSLIPELDVHLGPTLDEQLFNPLGLRISFHTRQVEVIQREEIAKAESAAFYIGGVANVAYEANVISVDEYRRVVDRVLVMGDMPKLDETFTPEERAPALPAGGDTNAPGTPEIPTGDAIASQSNPKALRDDLYKWERKAISRIQEGYPVKALEFKSDIIPDDVRGLVVYGLERARTIADVQDVFTVARGEGKGTRFIPEGADDPLPPVPDAVTISENDIDRALKSWDRLMPEFAGLLDATVTRRQGAVDAESVDMG